MREIVESILAAVFMIVDIYLIVVIVGMLG